MAQKFREAFFIKDPPDGKLYFLAVKEVGINCVVDMSEIHKSYRRHYESGSGWPKEKPQGLGRETILDALGIP